MKRIILVLSLFMTILSYAPPKVDKQPSNLEFVEKNYNKLAYASAGLLFAAAALNHDKIQSFANGYFQALRPYFNQKNMGEGALAMGLLFAVPLVYYEYHKGK